MATFISWLVGSGDNANSNSADQPSSNSATNSPPNTSPSMIPLSTSPKFPSLNFFMRTRKSSFSGSNNSSPCIVQMPWEEDIPAHWENREEELKSWIMKISSRQALFEIEVPSDFVFQWNDETTQKIHCLIKKDSGLAVTHFNIVPRYVSEYEFWRNYFYVVSVIKQTEDVKTLQEKLDLLAQQSRFEEREKIVREELIREMEALEPKLNECLDLLHQEIGRIISEKTLGIYKEEQDEQEQEEQEIDTPLAYPEVSPLVEQQEEDSATNSTEREQLPITETDTNSEVDTTVAVEEDITDSKSENIVNTTTTEESNMEAIIRKKNERREQMEELFKFCVESKKKLSILATWLSDESQIFEKINTINELFQNLARQYQKYETIKVHGHKSKAQEFEPLLLQATRNPPSATTALQRKRLLHALPIMLQKRNWKLLYSSHEHGISLGTFLRKAIQSNANASILFVETTKNTIFGAFLCSEWKMSQRYYGSGENFLFTFRDNGFEYYTWTKRNRFFIMSNESLVSIGGGENGMPGLKIDKDFEYGITCTSETFGNRILNEEDKEEFEILSVELWGFEEEKDRINREGATVQEILKAFQQ